MNSQIARNRQELGALAAEYGAEAIRDALEFREFGNIVLATGTSQFETLDALVRAPRIQWSRVSVFHLDEYIGLPETHPASFRGYLKVRFLDRVPGLQAFYGIRGDADDPDAECDRLDEIILGHPIDVAFLGIGENCHLAFNDPPADFSRGKPFYVTGLSEASRRQQLGEGWFASLEEVPRRAITMSIAQILKSGRLVVSVPERRKAEAVREVLAGPVSERCPASILKRHPECVLFLDEESASLL